MATTLKSPAAHLETTRSTNRLKNCLICKHPPIPRSPYCPRPLVATTAERDEKRAVGVGLATRRFGDETLARGWSGGSRAGKREIGRGTMDDEARRRRS